MRSCICVFFILALQTSYPQWQTYYVASSNVAFIDVRVVNQNLLWACGSQGKVYKTTNSGGNWADASGNLIQTSFWHITALNQNNAWVTGGVNGERIFRTTNGGVSWTEQTYNQPYWINEIHFFNANTGIFLRDKVGNDTAGFFITRNGGANWYRSLNSPAVTILEDNCMGAIDTNFVWFTDDNKFYRLTGGLDNHWQVHNVGASSLLLMFSCFVSSNTGYAGDGGLSTDGLTIFKTTNSGVNWTVYYNDTTKISSRSLLLISGTNLAFFNGGFDIKVSRNSAISWIYNTKYSTNDSVYMMYMDAFDTNSVWIAVNKGRLFKYNINFIGVESIGSSVPDKFVLYQNFPNPFNPATKIRFALPIASDFSIKVYDISGREVYSVYDSKQAGEYELTFDGSTYASGIYFYQIKAGDFIETKKMILLK